MGNGRTFDTAVIGAGVFGSWIAHRLTEHGEKVVLLDSYGGGNSRSSSGDESRVIRMGYGEDEIYTRMAIQSLDLWKRFAKRTGNQVFVNSGVLWLAEEGDPIVSRTVEVLSRNQVTNELLSRNKLAKRYPQMAFGENIWGLLEPGSGVLLARRSVQAVIEDASRGGLDYRLEEARFDNGSIVTRGGERIHAGRYVFACGPWLASLFPEVLGQRLFVTRQEVFYFGVPGGDRRFGAAQMPVWLSPGGFYGIPDLDWRGIKAAVDAHGGAIDPDTQDRLVSPESTAAMRARVGALFPDLAEAPLVESRVCQYENTSNGDFLIDRHPEYSNVWLVGGGSGHGFKHGPAVGEFVTSLLTGGGKMEPRFSLTTKQTAQARSVF